MKHCRPFIWHGVCMCIVVKTFFNRKHYKLLKITTKGDRTGVVLVVLKKNKNQHKMKQKLTPKHRKIAFLFSFLVLASLGLHAQTIGTVYLTGTSTTSSETQLFKIMNAGTTSATFAAVGSSSGIDYNALAYHANSGKLFAIEYPTSNIITVDTATGSVAYTGVALPSGNNYGAGEIVGNTMYVTNINGGSSRALYRINLVDGSYTSVTIGIGMADIAYYNGYLYGYVATAGSTIVNQIYWINPNTGQNGVAGGSASLGNGAVTSVWSDGSGKIYFSRRGIYNAITQTTTLDPTVGADIAPNAGTDGTWSPLSSPLTDGGTIAANQSGCGGFDPAPLTEITPASGGYGAVIEYRWWANGVIIPGATNATYDPPYISTAVTYQREARRGSTSSWLASNAVVMLVKAVPTANITANPTSSAGSPLNEGTPVSLAASGGNTYSWVDGPGGANRNVTANNTYVTYTVTATNTEGCSANASITVYGRSVPLPVTFSSFTATQNGCKVALTWVTENERNNDHFEVERSTGGKIFTSIGKADATNLNSRQQYNFTDERPVQGFNQYRITQVDVDGKRTSTSINIVNMNCAGNEAQVYPTLSEGTVYVNLPIGYEKAEMNVFNSIGQEVMKKTPGAGPSTLQLANLAKGQYLIRIVNGSSQHIFKVIYK
jgi:hypothetical protein